MKQYLSVSLFRLAQDRGHCLFVVNTVESTGVISDGQFLASCLLKKLWFDGLGDVVANPKRGIVRAYIFCFLFTLASFCE